MTNTATMQEQARKEPIKLTEEQQLYVLERRAEFVPPWKIKEELKELWGIQVSIQSLAIYDPVGNKTGKEKLGVDLQKHFRNHRKRFLDDRDSIALTHANYRMRRLQELIDDPTHSMNPEFVKEVIAMVEKIEGGLFRQREVSGSPIEIAAYGAKIVHDCVEALLARGSEIDPKVLADVLQKLQEIRKGVEDKD